MVEKASAFRHFIETEYRFSYWASQQRDRARCRPVVTPGRIFTVEVHQPLVGLDSLLDVDQWVRTAPSQRVVGPPANPRCPGSDSTLLRALGAWEHGADAPGHVCAASAVAGARVGGRCGWRWWMPATSAGSGPAGSASPAASTTASMWNATRAAATNSPASRRLLERATARLGEGFATHLLYDGLDGGA